MRQVVRLMTVNQVEENKEDTAVRSQRREQTTRSFITRQSGGFQGFTDNIWSDEHLWKNTSVLLEHEAAGDRNVTDRS